MQEKNFPEKGKNYNPEIQIRDAVETIDVQKTVRTTIGKALDDVQEGINNPYSKEVHSEGNTYNVQPPEILTEIDNQILEAAESLSADLEAIVKQG